MRFRFVWKKRKKRRSRKKGSVNIVKKLPDDPDKGEVYAKVVENPKTKKGRLVHFESTGKEGFGKWKIIKNEPHL